MMLLKSKTMKTRKKKNAATQIFTFNSIINNFVAYHLNKMIINAFFLN